MILNLTPEEIDQISTRVAHEAIQEYIMLQIKYCEHQRSICLEQAVDYRDTAILSRSCLNQAASLQQTINIWKNRHYKRSH
jgi:hypothetical protein